MKKLIIFGSVIIAIFVLLAVVTNMQNKQMAEGNPYGKKTLHPETIKQLDNPLYQNLILPDELEEVLDNNGSAFVFFYSPTCEHCIAASPIVAPIAEAHDVNLQKFNLLEFEDGWDTYKITGTPTIIRFENGAEVSRVEGNAGAEQFEKWFSENK